MSNLTDRNNNSSESEEEEVRQNGGEKNDNSLQENHELQESPRFGPWSGNSCLTEDNDDDGEDSRPVNSNQNGGGVPKRRHRSRFVDNPDDVERLECKKKKYLLFSLLFLFSCFILFNYNIALNILLIKTLISIILCSSYRKRNHAF